MPVHAISWKVQKGLKWNLVYTCRWMAVRGRAVHKNHNSILYIYWVIPLYNLFFIMDARMVACPAHILESSKVIGIKLGTYIYWMMLMKGSAVDKNHNPILHFTWVIPPRKIIKGGFLCHVLVYKWCWITSSAFYRQPAFGEHSSFSAILWF